jgi:phospholipase/carboxylesterase
MDRTTQLGGLTCKVIGPERPALAAILCHGFGAPGDDLVPIGRELLAAAPELSGVRFVFPAAPLDLSALGLHGARAWWHIDFAGLEQAVRGGPEALLAYRRRIPPGLAEARRSLHALLDEVAAGSGLPLGKVVLGGFSQGAMIATDLALRLEEPPAALVILSGAPVAEAEWEKRAPARAGLRVLQAHGRQDPVLPYTFGEALRELLQRAGLVVDFLPFEGGHGVPPAALARLAALLSACARSPADR